MSCSSQVNGGEAFVVSAGRPVLGPFGGSADRNVDDLERAASGGRGAVIPSADCSGHPDENGGMADHLSKVGRSRNMAAIKSKDTKPELALRSALRRAGATGYRVHRRDLPGRPDVAFIRWKVAVFVDGVFWHGHPDHWNPDTAASDYWRQKMVRNTERDRAADLALAERGWRVIRVWDVDVRDHLDDCVEKVLHALSDSGKPLRVGADSERDAVD